MKKNNGDLRGAIALLPDLPTYEPYGNSGFVKFNLDVGESLATSLYENELFTVALAESKKGAQFNGHSHKNIYEYIIMIDGEMELTLCATCEKVILGKNDMYVIPPNTLHSVIMNTDTVIVAMTVPPDPHFPHPVKP